MPATGARTAVSDGQCASRAATLAGSLGQLNAPSQYKADLATLQSSVTQVAGALHSIEAAAAAHDANAASEKSREYVL